MKLNKTALGFFGPFTFCKCALALSKTLAWSLRPACPRRLMPLLAIAGFLLSSANTDLATPHYVDVNGTNATPPFLGWGTAATNIQDAEDITNVPRDVYNGTLTGNSASFGGGVYACTLTNHTHTSGPGPCFYRVAGEQ